MNELIELSVSRFDWDGDLPGWRVPVLQLPVEIVGVSMTGKPVNPDNYESEPTFGRIRWKGSMPAPESLRIQLKHVEQGGSDEGLSARWRILAIVLPVVCTLLTATITYFFPLGKPAAPDAWSRLMGTDAYDSFLSGGSLPRELEGLWEVRLFNVDSAGQKTPYKVPGPDGKPVVYPPEKAHCKVAGSLVFFSAAFSTGEGEDLWAEGRVSQNRDITLMSWPRAGTNGETLVSVNLLRLQTYMISQPLVLSGWRIGVSRDLQTLRTSWIQYTKLPDY
jgi:hypothetical protein